MTLGPTTGAAVSAAAQATRPTDSFKSELVEIDARRARAREVR
jgi:hypothetical protein